MTMTEPVPVRDRSAWTAADVEADRSWCFELDDAGRAELEAALASVRARAWPGPGHRGRLPAAVAGRHRGRHRGRALRDGRGFAVLRGFPVRDRPLADVELLYWGCAATWAPA
ncbi:MAG: hypothetical protein R2749_09405 [Acidimicrobiales bacterium]